MSKRIIVGVQVTDRLKEAVDVQKVLTKYGCNIKTRLGLHEVSNTSCSTKGILILELYGAEKECKEFLKKLGAIKGINVKKMVFSE
jgi:hypothetical protein